MTSAARRASALGPLLLAAAVLLAACRSSGEDRSGPDARPSDTGPTTTVTPTSSAGCEAPEAATAGTTDRTMTSGGEERRFQVTLPEGYDGRVPLPVVFGLHGLTVDYRAIPSLSGFIDMADRYDFIAVSPSGLLDGTVPFWLAAPVEPNRDVAYLGDLLDLLEAELCIDPTQVFSTGMSNGGQMSSVLACQLGDRFTAVAPLAGVEWSPTCDGEPVPVLAFHGDADPVVTYDGGGLNAAAIADLHEWKGDHPPGLVEHGGVDEAMANWAAHNGCDPEPEVEALTDEVTRSTWSGCEAETILYRVVGGGHTWPGKPMPGFEAAFGPTTTDIDATDLMFEFFLGPPPE